MTSDKKSDLLAGLKRFVETDLRNMSEEELDEYIRADGDDPEQVLAKMQQAVNAALAKYPAIDDAKPSAKVIDFVAARRKLQELAANDPNLGQLTLAARMGNEMTDEEVRFTIEDLIELGVLKGWEDVQP